MIAAAKYCDLRGKLYPVIDTYGIKSNKEATL